METQCDEKLALSHRLDLFKDDEQLPTSKIDDDLEAALVWAQQYFGDEELIQAKEEFFWKTGKVFHDDPFYESRMAYFIDHFLLERPRGPSESASELTTPFRKFSQLRAAAGEEVSLQSFQHSIYQILKVAPESFVAQDLLTDEKVTVHARDFESFRVLQKKDVFQGFLYRGQEKTYLSSGLIFHPTKSIRILKKFIKTLRNIDDFDRLRELARMAKQNLRHLRHAHVDPKRIYSEFIE